MHRNNKNNKSVVCKTV